MNFDFSKGTGALKLTIIRSFLAPIFIFFYVNPPLLIIDGSEGIFITPVFSKLLAILVLIFAMLSDFFDGKIARKYNQVSDLGKILDPLSDALFFMVFYTTLACVSPFWMPFWLVIPILTREIVQHIFIRTYALKKGVALAAKWSGKIKMALSCFGSLYVLIIDLIATDMRWITEFMRDSVFGVLFAVSAIYLFSLIEYLLEVRKISKRCKTEQTKINPVR